MQGDNIIISKLEEIKKILNKTLGANFLWIDDTSIRKSNFYAFTVITDTIIASATGSSGPSIIGKTIPAGTSFYMTCSDITLTSGSLIAYNF